MEPSHPQPATGTGEDFIRRFWAFFEVLLVALAGPVLVQIGFIFLNIGSAGILSDTRTLFLFMASEACITLFLIVLLLRSRGESLRNIGWIWNNPGWGNPAGHRLCTLAFRVHSFGEHLL